MSKLGIRFGLAGLGCFGALSHAGVLPDDRVDLLWHDYDGGGIQVEGPSVLIQKKLTDDFAVNANYYTDMITSASIDVVTQASPYKEQRHQGSVGFEFLNGKTTYSGGEIHSVEPDYLSNTGYFAISQDMFGDLTNVSMGFTRGWDWVGRVDHGVVQNFHQSVDRRNWQLGISQILTRNSLLTFNYEATDSEGYLNNPYRSARYLSSSGSGYSYEEERYPHTRTGNALSLEYKYYLPYRASIDGSYRFYTDTWSIIAHTFTLGYTQPIGQSWILDGTVRYYRQREASFYSDLYPYFDSQNFLARDRELAAFDSVTLGGGVTYQLPITRYSWLQRSTMNFRYDRLSIHYKDFRDVLIPAEGPGTEPFYVLDANVMQFFLSAWY